MQEQGSLTNRHTWIKATNTKQYASWPGLTSAIVQKYFPESEETLKGHARKFKSGLKSTKKAMEVQEQDQEQEIHQSLAIETPTEESAAPTKEKKEIFVTTYDLQYEFQKKMCIDQTGCFPTKSSRGYTSWY